MDIQFQRMKQSKKLCLLFVLMTFCSALLAQVQSKKEQPLWPGDIPDNPIRYNSELVRSERVHESSPSKKNRVFSQVSVPTYILFQPEKGKAKDVAIVICPGGGFRDVWFDREGVDFAMWLAKRGITSLVLKYRTFNPDSEGFKLSREIYNKEVYSDAKQAIHILRSQADELQIDKNKIGIGGYSAGGALALLSALEVYEESKPDYANFSTGTLPDFACLVYPGIRDTIIEHTKGKDNIPPMFIINGAQDDVTPADKCIELYRTLLEKNIPAEFHIYSKGKHGFDSGIGRGHSVAMWQDSFISWLRDTGFLLNE